MNVVTMLGQKLSSRFHRAPVGADKPEQKGREGVCDTQDSNLCRPPASEAATGTRDRSVAPPTNRSPFHIPFPARPANSRVPAEKPAPKVELPTINGKTPTASSPIAFKKVSDADAKRAVDDAWKKGVDVVILKIGTELYQLSGRGLNLPANVENGAARLGKQQGTVVQVNNTMNTAREYRRGLPGNIVAGYGIFSAVLAAANSVRAAGWVNLLGCLAIAVVGVFGGRLVNVLMNAPDIFYDRTRKVDLS